MSLGLVSQEAQVTHMQSLSSLHRGLTHVWELGCTFLEEIITGLHTTLIRKVEGVCHYVFQNNNVTMLQISLGT